MVGAVSDRQGARPRAVDVTIFLVAVAVDLLVWGGDGGLRGGGYAPTYVVPMLTVAAYSTLLLRRRRPLAMFAVQWTFALAAAALWPEYEPFMALLVTLWTAARLVATTTAWWLLVAAVVPLAAHAANSATETADSPTATFLVSLMLWLAVAGTVWGLARLANVNERRAIQEREARAADAVAQERLRLARELHDIVSHAVSAMLLQAAGARALVPASAPQVASALHVIEDAGVQAMADLHRMLGLLRAPAAWAGDDVAAGPGMDDLPELAASTRASGVDVELVVDGVPAHLHRSVELAAYRLVQEALTNTSKYAGRGGSATVHVVWSADALTVVVRDRVGQIAERATTPSSGLGLLGLRERISLVGGTLTHGPVAGGFAVEARLPTVEDPLTSEASPSSRRGAP